MADDDRRFAVLEHLRLHDSAMSYLIVLADAEQPESPNARSDELRIYDTVGDTLDLQFRFLPEPRAPGDDPHFRGSRSLSAFQAFVPRIRTDLGR